MEGVAADAAFVAGPVRGVPPAVGDHVQVLVDGVWAPPIVVGDVARSGDQFSRRPLRAANAGLVHRTASTCPGASERLATLLMYDFA